MGSPDIKTGLPPWSAGQKYFKSLAHGRWGCNLISLIFKFISRIDIFSISYETILPSVWRPQDLTDKLVNTDSGNGLVPIRKWAITWASVYPDLCCHLASLGLDELTHWGLVTPYSNKNIVIISSGNGLSPVCCQAIAWTKYMSTGPLGTYFCEIVLKNTYFSVIKIN